MDEWESFGSNQLPAGLSLAGLFAQHNEHRLVTTRLLVWFQYHLNGWNLKLHHLLNFVIYGFILITSGWFAKEAAPEIHGWLILSFMIFLLSPINWFNHFMGYQTNVHLWLFCFLESVFFLFSETQRWLDLIIGSGAAVLSTYSMAGGVASSLVLVVMYGLFNVFRMRSSRESRGKARRFTQLIFVAGFLGATILLWLVNYRTLPYTPPPALPYEWKFWGHFLNLVAFGFGVDRLASIPGAFYLFIILTPILAIIRINKFNLSIGQWRVFVSTLGVLAVLASVSCGRAGFGIDQAKQSRYFEFGMLLIPLSVVNWAFLIQGRHRLKVAVMAGLWMFCFLGFRNNWNDFQNYKLEAAQRKVGLKCLRAYYEGTGDGYCPTIYPVPIPTTLLENAKALNVSFFRKMTR
jgi:hypothetical protein